MSPRTIGDLRASDLGRTVQTLAPSPDDGLVIGVLRALRVAPPGKVAVWLGPGLVLTLPLSHPCEVTP